MKLPLELPAIGNIEAAKNWRFGRIQSVVQERPSDDVEVSDVMPEMVDSCRSIGAATDAAMVSALAPGSCAWIWMVGKSTDGSAATPRSR